MSVSALVGSHRASRDGPSTTVTDTKPVTIKSQSYTTPRDSARWWRPLPTALAEDYERLRAAFRESAVLERAHRAAAEATAAALQQLRQDVERLTRELDAVLTSPSWRVGIALTALPRLIRDRRSS